MTAARCKMTAMPPMTISPPGRRLPRRARGGARALLVALLLTQTACGFHLRGSQPGFGGGSQAVYLRAADAERVHRALLRQLGAAASLRRADADYEIAVSREQVRRNALSVSPATGKVEEFNVNYSCLFSVKKIGKRKKDGNAEKAEKAEGGKKKTKVADTVLIDKQALSFSRDYTFDEDAVLSKFEEQRVIEEDLVDEAARAIIRRLRVVAAAPRSAETDAATPRAETVSRPAAAQEQEQE